MPRFFDDFDALDLFSLSLPFLQHPVQCPHCSKNHHMVSHGIVYKQVSIEQREPVGKRLLCTNRRGRSGCGRTLQLSIATRIPSLHYDATHLFAFLCAILAGLSISAAYQRATGQAQSRQAWRWLNKLMDRLLDYRRLLYARTSSLSEHFCSRVRRLKLLLPTIEGLFATLMPDDACADFQLTYQQHFF